LTQSESFCTIVAMPDDATIDSRAAIREQYKTPANFNARVRLHGRFSTNTIRGGMFRWIFDQIEAPPDARILELGSGTALFWRANQDRTPPGWRITLSDFSSGMLADVRANVAAIPRGFTLLQIDAQALPFDDHSFDVVIANHMLYHVPDRPRALGEIRRVLVPGARCYAATMGRSNMREFTEMTRRFIGISMSRAADQFGLETGFEYMQPIFSKVEVRRFEDALEVTEAQPLIDYIESTRVGRYATAAQKTALKEYAEAEIRARGSLHFTKDTGILIGTA
jgi:ubiquinone/menaquinone biosynthesis C-methylase UbiE